MVLFCILCLCYDTCQCREKITGAALAGEGTGMVRHIILWQLKDALSEEEKERVRAKIKEGLEGLQGKIPGLVSIHVQTERLPSSNVDLMLDCSFTDEAALKGYSVHPAHLAVANGVVRPNTKTRTCIDYAE